eukprot:6182114-Pleurochrysis_carterae.AAC.3
MKLPGFKENPPFSFLIISVGYKTVTAPIATEYQYILVVKYILTWLVTAIPSKTISAEEIFTALMKHIASCARWLGSEPGVKSTAWGKGFQVGIYADYHLRRSGDCGISVREARDSEILP